MALKQREDPEIFLEGIDSVIKLDLGKHKEMLSQVHDELSSYREAVSHESARKRHYYRLVGKGRYNDEALLKSVKDIRVNIRHLSDKVKLSEDKIEHHRLIVDTLTEQLEDYNRRYAAFHRQLQ
jgi:predicted TIM-barrel fold metal-dependent hydrolase